MTADPHPGSYVAAFLASTGTQQGPSSGGWTLASGQTYYVEFGGDGSDVRSVQLNWDAAIIMTLSLEDSNDPTSNAYSTSAREWTPENPSTAFVGVTGGSSLAAVVTVPGGTAGSCMFHVGSTGARRNRVKIVVGGTGGNANATAHGKG